MEPWRPYQPGDDPLALRYMTPEQVADLVERARLLPTIEPALPVEQGRTRGPRKHRKLTDEAVIAIREARAAGRAVKELAAEYGVSEASISSITRGRDRRWVAGPRLTQRIDARTFARGRSATLGKEKRDLR